MYGDIDRSEVESKMLWIDHISAETSFKKVRKASQYMIYHLRMNSVTGLIDSKEKTVFWKPINDSFFPGGRLYL